MIGLCRKKQGRKKQGVNNVVGVNAGIIQRVPNVFYIVVQYIVSAHISRSSNKFDELRVRNIMENTSIILDAPNVKDSPIIRVNFGVYKCY